MADTLIDAIQELSSDNAIITALTEMKAAGVLQHLIDTNNISAVPDETWTTAAQAWLKNKEMAARRAAVNSDWSAFQSEPIRPGQKLADGSILNADGTTTKPPPRTARDSVLDNIANLRNAPKTVSSAKKSDAGKGVSIAKVVGIGSLLGVLGFVAYRHFSKPKASTADLERVAKQNTLLISRGISPEKFWT